VSNTSSRYILSIDNLGSGAEFQFQTRLTLSYSRGYKLMFLLPNILTRRPHVAENDFTGVIVDAGTSDYKAGDAVFGFIPVRECTSLTYIAIDEAILGGSSPAENWSGCIGTVHLHID
jgi:hypothetical protein